jgi:hypothetical protein
LPLSPVKKMGMDLFNAPFVGAGAAVAEGLLLLQKAEEDLLLQKAEEDLLLCLHLYQGYHLHHQVHLLLEQVPVVVVVALGLELGELVCFLQLVLLLHFQTL